MPVLIKLKSVDDLVSRVKWNTNIQVESILLQVIGVSEPEIDVVKGFKSEVNLGLQACRLYHRVQGWLKEIGHVEERSLLLLVFE